MTAGRVSVAEGSILDLDAVMAVMDDSFDPVFGEAWTAPQCAGLLPMKGVWLSLARREDAVVGFALARVIVDEAELLLLAVRRSCRREGIGELLLGHFAEEAEARGASRLHLEVREGNDAVNLYIRCGFEEVGRRDDYYRGRDGAAYNALTLARSVILSA